MEFVYDGVHDIVWADIVPKETLCIHHTVHIKNNVECTNFIKVRLK